MKRHFLLWVALVLAAQMSWGTISNNTPTTPSVLGSTYYQSADNKKESALFSALTSISGGVTYSYTKLTYDELYTAYITSDVYPTEHANAGKIWDMYSTTLFVAGSKECGSYSKEGDCYNREHSMPKSWFGGSDNYKSTNQGCDLGHLVPTDGYVNGRRSNYAFGEVKTPTYTSNGGLSKLGSSVTSLNVDASTISGTSVSVSNKTVFEPTDDYKGDFARIYMYMRVRYASLNLAQADGGTVHFTNTTNAANDSKYGLEDYSVILLMKWHRQDPVSKKEIDRNNAMERLQGNRNPFIDYPILAEYLWGKYAGETFTTDNAVGSFEVAFVPGKSDGDKNGSVDPTPTPIPADYYLPVAGLKDSVLKSRLAEITWAHFAKVYSYGSGKNNTWDAFWQTDRNADDNSVIDMYSNIKRYFDPNDTTASVTDCDIEHMFPNSWFGAKAGNRHAYSDLHHLVPADYSANRSKSNRGPGIPIPPYTFDNGVWINGDDADGVGVFCPSDEYKGDFARAFFYVATTYGDTAVWQAEAVPNHMTNDDWHEFLDKTRNVLLKWHREDPVSEKELIRNNTVYGLQGNRNPFIDYPCLAEYIWGTLQGETFDLSCSDVPITKYTITWSVNGVPSSNQVIVDLQPTAPNVDDCSTDRVFVGWTTDAAVSGLKPEVLYKSDEIPNATEDATYYAVFADKEATGGSAPETKKFIFANNGYTNGQAVTSASQGDVTISFDKGTNSNAPKYYDDGTAIRCYGGNKISVLATGITQIVFDFAAKEGTNAISANTGTYDAESKTWTGKADEVVFTIGGTSGHRRIKQMDVTSNTGSAITYSNYGLMCEDCTPEKPVVGFEESAKSTTCGGVVSNVLDKGGSEGAVTYTSSKTDVATVNATTGAVTIKKVGTTTITANIAEAGCYTATSTSYTLTVNAKASTTTFTNPTTSLEEADAALNGATTTSDGTIVYASNNTAVATVNASTGVVTAVKPGTARITASVAATDCYAESSAYYDLTVTAIPTYTITWKANGVTVQTDNVKRGAGYSLPDDPDNCSEDRVFKGWTVEKNYEDASSAPEDLFNMALLAPILTQDTTIYAVYADKKTVSGQVTVTDSLSRSFTGITGTTYADWTDKVGKSGAVYAGNSAGGNSAIQLRTDNDKAGIITTTSPGTIKNVTLVWNSNTNTSRVVNVYGKDTPYSSAANLYSTETQGTLLGSMKKESNTKTSLDISGSYAYVGIRSNSAALYLDSVLVTWNKAGGETQTTYINYSTKCPEVYDFKALAATEVTHNSFMANWTESGGDYYTLDVTRDVKKEQAGTTVFDKNFTESLEGWTINNVSGYENVWTHSTSYGAYATSYKDKVRNAAESWLLSPNIDLKDVTAPSLTLNHVFRYGTTVSLNIKEESAVEWNELSPTNWSAASSWDFINSVADLSSYAGKTIQIGFKYIGTTEENKCPTWEIKRITITGTAEVDDLESIDGYPQVIYNTSALVSGLDSKTTYYYTVTSEDGTISNRIEVTTLESSEPTDMENLFEAPAVRKLLINGQLFILRDGKIYTIQGARVQ